MKGIAELTDAYAEYKNHLDAIVKLGEKLAEVTGDRESIKDATESLKVLNHHLNEIELVLAGSLAYREEEDLTCLTTGQVVNTRFHTMYSGEVEEIRRPLSYECPF